ncbi:MAG: hypothetical protein Crog4KO_19230 [Crocinitomicaceae bacterium]
MKTFTLIFFCLLLGSSSYSQITGSAYDTTHLTVRLNFKLLDWNVIDDKDVNQGYLYEFLSNEGLSALNQLETTSIDLSQIQLQKLFPFLSTSDSISISRQGNEVSVPPFWATFRANVPEGMMYQEFFSSLKQAYPVVIYAHPNFNLYTQSTPSDTLYPEQQSLSMNSMGIFMDSAWTITTGENWVKVGVFDTGIDSTHSELEVLTGKLADDNPAASWGEDGHGHGTKVAGIIGANRNDTTGIAGVAGGDGTPGTGVRLLDFRVGYNGIASTDLWSASIVNSVRSVGSYYNWGNLQTTETYYDYAPGYGVLVNNHSMAFVLEDMDKGNLDDAPPPPFGPGSHPLCFLCQEAFLFSIKNGVVSTTARGNWSDANGNSNSYVGPALYPGAYDDSWVMNIGSSGNDGERLVYPTNSTSQYFSSFGWNVDVIAPGSKDIVVTTDTVEAGQDDFIRFDGTSAAAPHVAGVAALLISYWNKPCYSNLNLDPADIEYVIEQSATWTTENTNSNGYHPASGHGRLNAWEALKMLDFPRYQIIHPPFPPINQQLLEVDTIIVQYNKPLNDEYGGPLGANNPLAIDFPYRVARHKVQTSYDFGQYMLDSTVLLDAWVRHGPTNSGRFIDDTTVVYDSFGDSTIVPETFGIEQMAYIDSIIDDSIIYLSGYYYHFIGQYDNPDPTIIFYDSTLNPINSPNEYWYPLNPFDPTTPAKMAYSIYIEDTTLLTRYDFPCDSDYVLLDSTIGIYEQSNNSLLIYPNPGDHELNVVFNANSSTNKIVTLIDATGRIVRQEELYPHENQVSFYTGDLKTGLYFVNLTGSTGLQISKKWIKR